MQKKKRRKAANNSEMASSKFSKFLTDLAVCLQGEKGPEIAYLLKPTGEHGKGLLKDFRNPTVRSDPLWFRLAPQPIDGTRSGKSCPTTKEASRAPGTRSPYNTCWS